MKHAFRTGKALWTRFSSTEPSTYASSIAYFIFLSLIPLIALSISLVSLAGIGQDQVVEFFTGLVPETFADFTKTLVDDAFAGSGVAFSLSTITLVWTATKGIQALRHGLNAVLEAEESRSAIAVAAISVGAVVFLGVLLAVTMVLVFGGSVMRAIAWIAPGLENHDIALDFINSSVVMVASIVVLALCYHYLPAGSRRFSAQLPGAALAAIGCGLLTAGFRIYVDNFCNYAALYGSIATIALFLFWLFLVSYILIAGAFVNRIIAEAKDGNQAFSNMDGDGGTGLEQSSQGNSGNL